MARHPRSLGALLAGIGLAGCTTVFSGQGEPDAEDVAERAAWALERGQYRAAFDDLTWVYTHFQDRSEGRYSLLLLATSEVDPGNPARRPGVGGQLLEAFLALPDNPLGTVAVGGALQRLSEALAAAEARAGLAEQARESAERIAHAEVARRRAAEQEVVRLRREVTRAQGTVTTVRRQTDRARSENGALQSKVGELERELAETRRELERVRRALGGGPRSPP